MYCLGPLKRLVDKNNFRAASLIMGAMIFTAASQLHSQTSSPVNLLEPAKNHKNSLNIEFNSIPGIPVQFAVYETRVSDFEAFVKATGYKWSSTPHFPQTGNHPVVNVNLQDAQAFCLWLTETERKAGIITDMQSYRLPTNQEWSAAVGLAAARRRVIAAEQEVEDSRSFPWGIEWPPPSRSGNFNSFEINGSNDGYDFTSPVGVFAASEEGLYDMAGNVWEWTWDQEERPDAPGTLRGGSWMYFRKECLLSGYTYMVPATLRAPSIGFRCVFEDKHRSAVFLANVQKEADAQALEKRAMFKDKTVVSSDEIKRMRDSLQRTPVAEAKKTLPDPSTLEPAKSDKPFTNSLGMSLRPLGVENILFGEHEVRVQDYEEAQKAQGKAWTDKPSFAIKETHPIVNVTWDDANKFCEWLTEKDRAAKLIPANAKYRLPTDAEWSTAAGLSEDAEKNPMDKHQKDFQSFPWGTSQWPPPPLSANLDTARMTAYSDNFTHTAPVGSFSPNALHIYDLAGNVAEWCQDTWPANADARVVRGSSWLSSTKESCLSSYRQHFVTSSKHPHIGFRVVLDLAPAK